MKYDSALVSSFFRVCFIKKDQFLYFWQIFKFTKDHPQLSIIDFDET